MAMQTARDRAEDWLQSLQKRARDFMDAEDGLVRTVRDLVEERGLSKAEVRRRLEELVGRLKANGILERLSAQEAATLISDYRDEMERRIEDTVQRVLASLQIVTTSDLLDLDAKLKAVMQRVEDLHQRFVLRNGGGAKPDDA